MMDVVLDFTEVTVKKIQEAYIRVVDDLKRRGS